MTSASPWILGSAGRDLAFMALPVLAVILLSTALPETSRAMVVATFLVFYCVDSGHGVVTALRAYRRGAFEKLPPLIKRISVFTPVAAFALVFAWIYLRVPHFWTALLYATVFHHIRQFYGVLRWYQKLNGRFDSYSHLFLYALLIVPLAALHVRPDLPVRGHFTGNEGLMFPHSTVFYSLVAVEVVVWSAWVLWEIAQRRRYGLELNRILAIGLPALVSSWCCFSGANLAQILLPLVLMHGCTYFVLVGLSLERLGATARLTWRGLTVAVALLAAAYGAGEYFFEERWMIWDYTDAGSQPVAAVLIALYTFVPLSHYVLDAFLWRSDHPDAERIYGVPSLVRDELGLGA